MVRIYRPGDRELSEHRELELEIDRRLEELRERLQEGIGGDIFGEGAYETKQTLSHKDVLNSKEEESLFEIICELCNKEQERKQTKTKRKIERQLKKLMEERAVQIKRYNLCKSKKMAGRKVFNMSYRKNERMKEESFNNIQEIDNQIKFLEKAEKKIIIKKLDVDQIKKYYGALKKYDKIEEVHCIRNGILIRTKDIDYKKFNLGKYDIFIDLYHQTIRIKRTDGIMIEREKYNEFLGKNDIRHLDHPFIQEGRPCYGNISTNLQSDLKEGNFYAVAIGIIELLQSKDDNFGYMEYADFIHELRKKLGEKNGQADKKTSTTSKRRTIWHRGRSYY